VQDPSAIGSTRKYVYRLLHLDELPQTRHNHYLLRGYIYIIYQSHYSAGATKMAKQTAIKWGKRYGNRRQQRIDFMNDVKGRLENDVGPYFDCIEEVYRRTQRYVGFWALPRMLFPIIEAVATTVFRRSKAGAPAVRLLRRLGLQYPALTWEMYRNVLMHGDELLVATYRGYSVRWAVAIGDGHRSDNGRLTDFTERTHPISTKGPTRFQASNRR
jgi:hypothetical protein